MAQELLADDVRPSAHCGCNQIREFRDRVTRRIPHGAGFQHELADKRGSNRRFS